MLKHKEYSRLQSSSSVCGISQPRYKCYINSPWSYNLEDALHLTLVLLLLVLSDDMAWIQLVIFPNLFICIVVTTIFILKSLDQEKCGFHVIILIPFWMLATLFTVMFYLFGLLLFPFRCSRALIYELGMQQFAFYHQYQHTLLKYLFNIKQTDKELRIGILAINYYLLSLYKHKNNGEKNRKNLKLIGFIANKNNNGSTLDDIKWSDIRKMSKDRRNIDLYFAFTINLCVIIYRMYHMILILYAWIYYYYLTQNVNYKTNASYWIIIILLMIHVTYKTVVFYRCLNELFICFVMFHILLPKKWIPMFNETDIDKFIEFTGNNNNYNYQWINCIEIIDDIFNCLIYSKQELLNRTDINNIDLINVILKYSVYPLPIDGDMNDIYNVLSEYLKTT